MTWLAFLGAAVAVPAANANDGLGQVDADAGDAGDASTPDPTTVALLEKTHQVRALLADTLDVSVAPASLFEVEVDDGTAVALEAQRLAALLSEVDAVAHAREGKGKPTTPKKPSVDAGDASTAIDERLWRASVELDRARLVFYRLPPERRAALFTAHAERREAARAARGESDAARREREAHDARERALEAARQARTEVERLISEERAHLLDVEGRQAAFSAKLADQRKQLAAHREATLKWQRKARELREGAATEGQDVDATYVGLRTSLGATRENLAAELSASSLGEIPRPHANVLVGLGAEVDTSAQEAERKKIEAEATRLEKDAAALREERLAQLFQETNTLNQERVALLPFLSAPKREAITGFTQAGLEQASGEVRQLSLILRYHRYVATEWLRSLRQPRQGLDKAPARGALVLVEWLVAVALFFSWRRRVPHLIAALRRQAEERDATASLTKPSFIRRGLLFATQVRRPLEWLALVLVLGWLLPVEARELLEVQLVLVALTWSFIGGFIVNGLDSLASSGSLDRTDDSAPRGLRLRSLRLVGRTVVTVGLILVISSRLVGQGTIYRWVLSTSWFASIPLFFLLIRWWKPVVFARADLIRKPSAFERWILANKTGWRSFFAASLGGVYLFGYGVQRALRGWVGRFDVTRRAMAYLFRRELDKLGASDSDLALGPLSEAASATLGPEVASAQWIATAVDQQLDALVERIRARRGGLVLLVGERGMGKTSALRRLCSRVPHLGILDTSALGLDGLRAELAAGSRQDAGAALEAVAAPLARAGVPAILLDNLHRFVQPVMGGMVVFDQLLALASRNCATTTWVFTLDHVVWQFLERARGARPLFDEVLRLTPWSEKDLVRLFVARTAEAQLSPRFEHLLETLPAGADETDRLEALDRREASYYRLIWDYAAGNPGVALHTWRSSLGVDIEGNTWVRVFQAPDTRDFERLPDATLFVLKAVLQLSPAAPAIIVRATMLRAAEVDNALRYALAKGYIEESDGLYRVTWTWLRVTTLFLQRRHLLVLS